MTELRDAQGNPIVPSLIPPTTDFPFPQVVTTEPTPPESPSRNISASETQTDLSRPSVQQQNTLPTATAEPRPFLASRAGTAPIPGTGLHVNTGRPSARKHSSLLGLIPSKKDAGKPRPYNHEDYSSDSDSSVATEDEGAKKRRDSAAQSGKGSDKAEKDKKAREQASKDPGQFSRFSVSNDHFKTKGRVSRKDGRLKISLSDTSDKGYLAKALGLGIKRHLVRGSEYTDDQETSSPITEASSLDEIGADLLRLDSQPRPKMNIVIMVIGSRGDIQPFLRIAQVLKNDYGHRVRLATHPAFKEFVEKDSGLEFFSIGGNPSELMAFMVKNPGLIPSIDTVKAGEIGRRRAAMYEMFQGMWRACINATDDERDKENMKMMGSKSPFVADAIIANPPSMAPIHIAERLGVPLHMMFTFPWTPTQQFPHPLANIRRSNMDPNYTNLISYPLVEMMTWQGLGDLVNKFREKTLGLEPVSRLWAPGQLFRLKVPFTYMWSPALVPKPRDWGPEIDIGGFVFLDLASSFKPPDSLVKFLEAGEPPVYIGFGSIVVDDPEKFTEMIFEAVRLAGVRALVSKGWGGLGGQHTPDNIYMLENTPHDWLFPRVSAVVHHGGAGTTAIGLKCGKPTMIVPFFGDQPFWGAMVSRAKAGADFVPYKDLTAEKLAKGIKQCLSEEARTNAKKIAEQIEKEGDGAINAVKSFHRSLPLRGQNSMRCTILTDRIAAWHLNRTKVRLSPLAAERLVEMKKIKWHDLSLLRHCDWTDFDGPGEPITGILSTITGIGKGVGSVPVHVARKLEKRRRHEEKKRKHLEKKKLKQAAQQNGTVKGGREADVRPGAPRRHDTDLSALSAEPEGTVAGEILEETGRGFLSTGIAVVRAPMDLAVAISQGFHNAPRLYGDDTVRRPIRITGWKSGLKAGRNEFVYGIYDGVSGLWLQPYRQVQKHGPLGLVKGLGMGLGGFVLKDIAAIIGPFGYSLKGIQKELEKSHQPIQLIRRARIHQGQLDLQSLTPDERHEVDARVAKAWETIEAVLDALKKKQEQGPIKGRLALLQAKRTFYRSGAAESVDTAQRALEASRRGQDVGRALKADRVAAEKANLPRLPALQDPAEEEGVPTLENGRVLSGVRGLGNGSPTATATATATTATATEGKRPCLNGAGEPGRAERSLTEARDWAMDGRPTTTTTATAAAA